MSQLNPIFADEDSISLFTSLLVRYPELGTINYSSRGQILKLSFILKDKIPRQTIQEFSEELNICIIAYTHFEGQHEPKLLKVTTNYGPGITLMEISRDSNTLTQKEIGLIINYLRDKFAGHLVCENYTFPEEELLEHDDLIRSMLDSLRKKNPKKNLIAVREEGRVLVFNKR